MLTRSETTAALPRMAAVTKLKPAVDCAALNMVPLRSGAQPAKEAYWNEALDEAWSAAIPGSDLPQISPGGLLDIKPLRAGMLKNKCNGIRADSRTAFTLGY